MNETILKDIGLYKTRLLSLFLQSPDICELLLGKGYTEEQLRGTNNSDEDYGIVYKQIYPYLYIDETQTEALTYLCFEVDIPRIPTGTIKDMKIIIWCYCSKDCMKFSRQGYLGTRADVLADMVERQVRHSDRFGVGALQLDSATYMNSPTGKYYGRQLIFTTPDFKRKY